MIPESKIAEIVELNRFSKPAGATHWPVRSMATPSGVFSAQVQRIWAARGLKPHRAETFKLSTDPHFDEKLIEVCGLFLDPPEKAIVLCLDEKTSSQALDHRQRRLGMIQGPDRGLHIRREVPSAGLGPLTTGVCDDARYAREAYP